CEISKDDGVLVGQRVSLVGENPPTAHGQSYDQHCCADDQHCCADDRPPSNVSQGGLHPGLDCWDGCPARIGIALQPTQIRADVCCTLVSQVAVLLQRLLNNAF